MGEKLSLRLRAYSFSLRQWRTKQPDKVYSLNSKLRLSNKETGEEFEYANFFELFKDFICAYSNTIEAESSQQLFSCRFDSRNQGERGNFTYLIFSVFSGYYGYASDLVDRESKQVVHHKTRDQADVKEFFVIIAIPKDTGLSKTRRGLILFQEIGVYGIKTITTKEIQKHFSQKFGVTFRDRNLAPDFYLQHLFESGLIKKIRIARNCTSEDSVDALYGFGYGREERTIVPLKITSALKRKLMHVSESKFNFFTVDGIDFSETKMVVELNGRPRVIDLHGLDNLSVEEVLSPELLQLDGTIDFEAFKENALVIAEEYLHHLPNDI